MQNSDEGPSGNGVTEPGSPGSKLPEPPEPPPAYRKPGLAVGDILGESLSMSMGNFFKFSLICLLVYSPLVIWGIIVMQKLQPSLFGLSGARELNSYVIGLSLAAFLLQPIATGAIIYGVFRKLKDQNASLGKCLAIGISRLLPLLGMAVLLVLAVAAISVIPFLLVYLLARAGGGMAAVILTFAALIPAVMVFCAAYAAAPAIVVEKLGPLEGLRRSFQLTKDNRWRIFGVVLVIGVAQKIITWIVEKICIDPDSVRSIADVPAFITSIKVYLVVIIAVSVVFEVVTSVAGALIYYRLKVSAEGADQAELASVFD
jgi:hypothetical protein